jgi:hypothetical protein
LRHKVNQKLSVVATFERRARRRAGGQWLTAAGLGEPARLCILARFQWLSDGMMRVSFIAMVVVGLIGFASMVAFVLR